jgi:hypothetical protein
MVKKLYLSQGNKHSRKETENEVMDLAQRFCDDFFPVPSQKNPITEKPRKPIYSRRFIQEYIRK